MIVRHKLGVFGIAQGVELVRSNSFWLFNLMTGTHGALNLDNTVSSTNSTKAVDLFLSGWFSMSPQG